MSEGTGCSSFRAASVSLFSAAQRPLLISEVRHSCQTDLIEFGSYFVARGEQIEPRHRSVLRRNGRTWNNRRRRPVPKPENDCCCLSGVVHRKGGQFVLHTFLRLEPHENCSEWNEGLVQYQRQEPRCTSQLRSVDVLKYQLRLYKLTL